MSHVYVILHNIRSTHNVGSILRTADGAGVEKVYLTGCTPSPVDRFGRKRKDVAKVALGAEDTVPWEHADDMHTLIQRLRNDGVRVVAVEQDKKAKDYRTLHAQKSIALIFGEETQGIPKETLNLCDQVVEIPMHGKKESLNVSVAAGVVLYQIAS